MNSWQLSMGVHYLFSPAPFFIHASFLLSPLFRPRFSPSLCCVFSCARPTDRQTAPGAKGVADEIVADTFSVSPAFFSSLSLSLSLFSLFARSLALLFDSLFTLYRLFPSLSLFHRTFRSVGLCNIFRWSDSYLYRPAPREDPCRFKRYSKNRFVCKGLRHLKRM